MYVYVCMCEYVLVCMCVCLDSWMYACLYIRLSACVYARLRISPELPQFHGANARCRLPMTTRVALYLAGVAE